MKKNRSKNKTTAETPRERERESNGGDGENSLGGKLRKAPPKKAVLMSLSNLVR